jgi:hypothetical protein
MAGKFIALYELLSFIDPESSAVFLMLTIKGMEGESQSHI